MSTSFNLRRTADTSKLQAGGAKAGRAFVGAVSAVEQQNQRHVDTFRQENPDVSDQDIDKIKELFVIFDTDFNGELSAEELSAMYERLGKPKSLLEVKKEIKKFDKNASGTIDLYEYLNMSLGSESSPFLKTLLFFKRLEIQQAEEAARALSPRDAFMKDRAK
jgi:hypothetical protein